MKNTRYQLNKKKYLIESEYERLHKKLEKLIPYEPRNAAILFLALYTGARAQELLNTTWADLDTRDKTIFIRGLKGSDDREIPIPDWLFNLVKALPRIDKKSIFNITYQRLYQIWNSLKPNKEKKFHSLRHTFAIRLYKKTQDIRLVQVALGHRSVSNTMIYAAYQYSTIEMKRLLLD